MSRKKEPTHVTEKNIFPTRLRKLMEDQSITQKKLADAIEMRPQTVSLYTTGQSAPDVNTLRKMAEFFHVSADYLIGLTDVKKPDTTIQAVCEYTGLSESAIKMLHTIQQGVEYSKAHPLPNSGYNNWLPILSYLIEDWRFCNLFFYFLRLKDLAPKLDGYTYPSQNPEDIVKVPDGYHIIEDSAYYDFLRYELSTGFNDVVNHFVSSIMPDTNYEGGSPNAIYQEIDHQGG